MKEQILDELGSRGVNWKYADSLLRKILAELNANNKIFSEPRYIRFNKRDYTNNQLEALFEYLMSYYDTPNCDQVKGFNSNGINLNVLNLSCNKLKAENTQPE